jgi:outer membrane protein, heavy metal efflux system
MLRLTRICIGMTVLGLAGCASYQAAPLNPRQSAEQFAARRLEDPQLQEAVARILPRADSSWPPPQWDRGQLLAIALVRNPQLAVARAQVRSALAREVTARQLLNPDMALLSEYGAHGEPHPWLYGVAFDWTLQPPGRRHLEQEVARLDTGNSRFRLMDGIWEVRRGLSAALSEWEYARRRRSLLDQLAFAQDRVLELEHQRIQSGEDSPQELAAVEQARTETEQQQVQARTVANAAQAGLARALGLSAESLDGLQSAWPDWGAPPAVDQNEDQRITEQALLSRSDLEEAMGEYSITEARFKLAVKRQYPELSIGPGYYWDHGVNKFPLDVGFTLPLDGNRGEIAEARAAREVAGAQMQALQAAILGEITEAKRAEDLARAGAETAQRRLENVQRQSGQRELSVKLGESDVFEQAEIRILTTRAELEALEMRALWQAARNHLEDVLHMPLSGPEVALAKSVDLTTAGDRS